jgi:hypothetical protein
MPPLIPFIVHVIARLFIPADETLYHAMFTLAATIPAWLWSQTMIDRLRLSYWKAYLVVSCVWGAVLLSALMSPTLVNYAVRTYLKGVQPNSTLPTLSMAPVHGANRSRGEF